MITDSNLDTLDRCIAIINCAWATADLKVVAERIATEILEGAYPRKEETASGGGRCTAGGACCPDMRLALEDRYVYQEKGFTAGIFALRKTAHRREGPHLITFNHCPWCGGRLRVEGWCGKRLGGEESGSDSEAQALLEKLVRIDDALESGETRVSNQGQAMDGYTALAEFRSIAQKARELLGGEG